MAELKVIDMELTEHRVLYSSDEPDTPKVLDLKALTNANWRNTDTTDAMAFYLPSIVLTTIHALAGEDGLRDFLDTSYPESQEYRLDDSNCCEDYDEDAEPTNLDVTMQRVDHEHYIIRAYVDGNRRSGFSVEYEDGPSWNFKAASHGTTENLENGMARAIVHIIAQTFLIRLVAFRELQEWEARLNNEGMDEDEDEVAVKEEPVDEVKIKEEPIDEDEEEEEQSKDESTNDERISDEDAAHTKRRA